MPFRPMLAACENPLNYPRYFEELTYPKWASPKYDGIRAIPKGGLLFSRNFKPIPSLQCQDLYSHLEHRDGELLEGGVFDHDVYNRTQSHVMAEDNPGNMTYMVFDYTHPDWLDEPFYKRHDKLISLLETAEGLQFAEQREVNSLDELLETEEEFINLGAEGLILKDPLAPYKQGRSTWRQGWAVKLKRECQNEAVIEGFEEKRHNLNRQTRNALGYAERSHHQDNKVGAGMVGTILGREIETGEAVRIAPGSFTHEQLEAMWENQERFVGEVVTFQHFPHGSKDTFRQARAKGFRDRMDF